MWYDKYLKDNPTYVDNEFVCWEIEGDRIQYHRLDGPAYINKRDDYWWYKNDKLHREDGPAIMYCDHESWCIHDLNITTAVTRWIKEHNYPDWKQWDDGIKLHFKLTFVG